VAFPARLDEQRIRQIFLGSIVSIFGFQ
jgi:hypothetical protein